MFQVAYDIDDPLNGSFAAPDTPEFSYHKEEEDLMGS
jgi:hypothetical protein